MGKTSFAVAESIVAKLIARETINIELEFENFNSAVIDDDFGSLCNEIQRRIRVWFLQESSKYTEPELEVMKAKNNFLRYAIAVFEDTDNLCNAIMCM